MATTKEIKRRVKSVSNTKKITKAMELVAAAKMRRAVGQTLASRAYAGYAWDILQSLAAAGRAERHPLFEIGGKTKDILAVLITSNRGLCGAYNTQVLKKMAVWAKDLPGSPRLDFISIGRKGDLALKRLGLNIIASFADLPDSLALRDIMPIVTLVTKSYQSGTYSHVFALYTDYISALSQVPRLRQLLPIEANPEVGPLGKTPAEYLFEPSYYELMPPLVNKLARMQVYQMLLESIAAEQSARMVAMKNASDAAGEMIGELTLLFNKNRQAAITREISEISAGMTLVV